MKVSFQECYPPVTDRSPRVHPRDSERSRDDRGRNGQVVCDAVAGHRPGAQTERRGMPGRWRFRWAADTPMVSELLDFASAEKPLLSYAQRGLSSAQTSGRFFDFFRGAESRPW